MFKLPFGSLPAHWGLAGKSKEIAKAEYELTGHELARRILEINKDDYEEEVYQRRVLETDFKFGKIDVAEYHRGIANLIQDPKQKALAVLELDYREHKITDMEYQKQSATLNGEPWVTVLDMDFTQKNSLEGSFELDWNEHFVEKLKAEGYTGPTPDNIVNQWFMEVCRNVAMEEFDGTGDFTADSQANLDTVKRWSTESKSFGEGRKGYR